MGDNLIALNKKATKTTKVIFVLVPKGILLSFNRGCMLFKLHCLSLKKKYIFIGASCDTDEEVHFAWLNCKK
jgi:hypothetical protein